MRSIKLYVNLFSMIVLTVVSANAKAEWIAYDIDVNKISYYDPRPIKIDGDAITMVILHDFTDIQTSKSGRRYLSKFHYYEFGCKEMTFNVVYTQARSGNMGQGKGVFQDKGIPPKSPVTSVIIKKLWHAACDTK